LLKNLQESAAAVCLIAALFCVFFWAGFFAGRTTVQPQLPIPAADPVRVNLAGN